MTSRDARLGQLVTIVGGGTPDRKEPSYWGPGTPWATVKDLVGLRLSHTQESITQAGLENSAATLAPAGSVIVATRMALGKAVINTVDVAINQDLKALTCGPDIEASYLQYFLLSQATRLERMGKGATVKGITLDRLIELSVPVPPLAEQRRIAAVLDKADGIRRKREESLQLLDGFLRSAFLEMFGDPVRNEKGWKVDEFGSVIRSIEPGVSVKGEDGAPGPTEWAVLKISAVTSGRYVPEDCKVVRGAPERLVVPARGDLLFSRANTRELVAATCIVDRAAPRVFLPDKLWKITSRAEVVTNEYLRYLLAEPRFRATLTRHATGTSGSMLNVSQEKLLRLRLPIPPIHLQQRFANQVWRTYDTRARLNEAGNQADKLFDSLAQRAFRGEL